MAVKLGTLFSSAEIARISFTKNGVTVDVHSMRLAEATRFIRNIACLCETGMSLRVIHGFNNGHAIRDKVRQKGFIRREYYMCLSKYNDGVTVFHMV